jgi:glycopeptide antibiotics resistance protein
VIGAFGYTAFVIYGSLVPLDFRPRPFDEAWHTFRNIRYLNLGIGSRADWVANILLFVPFAFLWTGILSGEPSSPLRRALASVFVFAGAAGLALAIEFAQIFFPPRTVSANDLLAEGLGAIAGIVLWWLFGRRVIGYLSGWSRLGSGAGTAQRLLAGYLFLMFGYNLLPLDLTISPIEVFHKWREGKLILIPFGAHFESFAQRVYDIASDAAIWIPAAFLWQMSSPLPPRRNVLRVTGCAALLELLQLFVYSRVTDVTDILTAAAGAAIGAVLAVRFSGNAQRERAPTSTAAGGVVLWFAALAVWLGVIVTVFWYPFDFNTEWGFVHRRLDAIPRVPFVSYYYGTEFRAVTEVLHKLGFFLPLGALLGIGTLAIRRRLRIPAFVLHVVATIAIAGVAGAIEAGQLFLPGKYADPTDWVLELLGGLAGYFGTGLIASRSGRTRTSRHPIRTRSAATGSAPTRGMRDA